MVTSGPPNSTSGSSGDIEKMEYIQVKHLHDGWSWARCRVQRKTDLTIEKAKKISEGMSVDIDEMVAATVNVVGFRMTGACSRYRALRSRPVTWCSGPRTS